MADQTTPERWVEQAFLCAERACGTVAADVVSVRIKTALACEALVAIFAAQEVANGEHMRAAAEMMTLDAERHFSMAKRVRRTSDRRH